MPNQQEVFEAAHAHVAKWEGGYFDHPDDPGGVTMYGVSLMFLKGLDLWEGDIDGDGDIDRDDVLAVTKDTARDIFKRHFWDRPRAGEMPPLVAVCFYDFAGNAGIKAGGVKEGDGPDARLPRKKIIPGFGDVAAERRQRRETGYNNAFAAHNSLMKQKVVERLMI